MRFYDAKLGRFLSRDRLREAVAKGGITEEALRVKGIELPPNPYLYANDSPLGLTDPTGLSPNGEMEIDFNGAAKKVKLLVFIGKFAFYQDVAAPDTYYLKHSTDPKQNKQITGKAEYLAERKRVTLQVQGRKPPAPPKQDAPIQYAKLPLNVLKNLKPLGTKQQIREWVEKKKKQGFEAQGEGEWFGGYAFRAGAEAAENPVVEQTQDGKFVLSMRIRVMIRVNEGVYLGGSPEARIHELLHLAVNNDVYLGKKGTFRQDFEKALKDEHLLKTLPHSMKELRDVLSTGGKIGPKASDKNVLDEWARFTVETIDKLARTKFNSSVKPIQDKIHK